MPKRFTATHIQHIPAFSGLSPNELNRLAEIFQTRRYTPGELIFRQGEPTRGMHIFIEGRALLWQVDQNGQQQQVGQVAAGQFVNQEAIFADGVETATLQVVEPVFALFLPRQTLATFIAQNNDIKQSLGLTRSKSHHVSDVKFKNQREDEHVLLMTRRHWWAWVRWVPLPAIVMVLFWILAFNIPNFGVPIVIFSLVIGGLMLAYAYAEWANDTVIITDQRVIRITHTILTLSERISEIALDSVQETGAYIPSNDPFAVVFQYGTVDLKTAGDAGNLQLPFIPNPVNVQQLILQEYKRRERGDNEQERQVMRAELERWLTPGATNDGFVSVEQLEKRSRQIEEKVSQFNVPLSPFQPNFQTDGNGVIYRKHWFLWLRAVSAPGVFMIASIIGVIASLSIPTVGSIVFGVSMLVLIVSGVWFAFNDWDWRNDYMLVTDATVTLVHQRPLWLQSERDQVLLRQVDNVIAESTGFWERLLRYGDVQLSLVGADQHKIFNNVPMPLDVQNEITRRQRRVKRLEEEERERNQRETIGEYLQMYHEQYSGNNAQPAQPRLPQNQPQTPYQTPANNPQIRPAPSRDNNRPPGVPRSGSISRGQPYQPQSPYRQTANPPNQQNTRPNPPANTGDNQPTQPRRRPPRMPGT